MAAALSAALLPTAGASALTIDWTTVVNNGVLAPGSTTAEFFSYNQPSVNDFGLVVFRARARPDTGGGGGAPIRGIYVRDMGTAGSSIVAVAEVDDTVPQPNNLGAEFNEFPAFPRIDSGSSMIATRGQTTPVWEYTLPDLTETRVGTAGIFTTSTPLLGGANLITGVNQLGAVPGFEEFSVPDAPAATKFDQFPGAASASDGKYIAFKGNYQDGVGKTGVYFRDVTLADSPVIAIADTSTDIPGGGGAKFGSTAPPSAANGKMVFTGLDNEEAPTKGGIYLAPLQPNAPLTTLVSIGATEVPGQPGQTLNRVGEGLSFDGRYVAFWGAWGTETRSITLACPTDGNAAAACALQYPTGFQTSVPVNQGIFRIDTQTGQLTLVAKTDPADPDGFDDFLYWTFSGAVEGGGGEGDAEPPRWRSSAFAALDGERVAFKGTKIDESEVVGIYGLFGDAIRCSPCSTRRCWVRYSMTTPPLRPTSSPWVSSATASAMAGSRSTPACYTLTRTSRRIR